MSRVCPNPACPDIELFGVIGEYSEGVETCPKCGTPLVSPHDLLSDAAAQPPAEEDLVSSAGGPASERVSIAEAEPGTGAIPASGKLVEVAAFRDVSEAHLAKALLESSGIPVHLREACTVGVHWLLSQGLGGIGLLVPEELAGEARAILAQDAQEETEGLFGLEAAPLPGECCPRCGSPDITTRPWTFKLKVFLLPGIVSVQWVPFLLLLPLFPLLQALQPHRCRRCGATWAGLHRRGRPPSRP